jgi:hypothetical protein
MRSYWLLRLLFLFSTPSWSQVDSVKWVNYNSDFRFTDGIYLSFDQVKSNKPLLKSRVISTIEYDNPEFFDILLSKTEILYYDYLGMKQTVKVTNIWGYAKNGDLFIRMYDSFNKITYMGSICHFLAIINVNYQPMYDPYYYNPYYYYSGWSNTVSVSKTEIKQFIMDFSTGKILDYEEKNLEILLMRDLQLYDEFMGLSRKKKQQLKFYYIRKFNEHNPLKIPVYSSI